MSAAAARVALILTLILALAYVGPLAAILIAAAAGLAALIRIARELREIRLDRLTS